jgi:D-aspartate ligase
MNMPASTPSPTALVMNPYYTGLGIARALRGSGVPIVALSSEPDIPGARSRYFDQVLMAPNGRDEPEALCDFLVKAGAGFSSKPVLFPTRDFDVIFLEQFHDVLAPWHVLPQPGNSPILRMMDKLELAGVAMKLGLPTPRTVSCDSAEVLEIQASAMRFPVIAKPRYAFQWRQQGLWEKVGAQKAFIADSREELRRLYSRLAAVTEEVLLQEYIPGVDMDIVVCCAYIGRDGKPKGHFTGRKLKQSPPLVGTGCVVEAVDCPAIVSPTFELLNAFGYTGIAEVEFKLDKATGIYYLIEINPRHWDQHELGTLVGINISRLAYEDMLGRAPQAILPTYPAGSRCVWVAERELALDIGRSVLAAIRAGPPSGRFRRGVAAAALGWRETSALLRGRRIYSMSRLSDPLPGANAGWSLAKDVFLAVGRRLRKA